MAAETSTSITKCTDCDINNCLSLQRIVQICDKYEDWLYYEQNKEGNPITDSLKQSIDSYPMKDILNDYNHIKEHKYSLSSINIVCSRLASNCVPSQRHRRNNNLNYQQQYFGESIPDIIIQKLFDQIHIYLYHPFTNNIKGDYQKNKRFGTNVPTQNEQQKEVLIKKEEKYNNNEKMKQQNIAYNFGQQFFYWDQYKNHHWFIIPKYNNLKEELLTNSIYKIGIFIWNIEYQNAVNKLEEDEKVKELRSNHEFRDKYSINKNITITMNHLLSILLYCNTDELQNRFSATYRRLQYEKDDEMKVRHSHFYYFGRFLRETVEVFGNVLVDDNLALYHGIDRPLYFNKMIAKFYGPTSTSKNRVIAAHFAGNDGMILQFCKYERNAFYFDCFLSGYDREKEYLFIGGYAALRIQNILHFISTTDGIENYSKYIKSIECLLSIISNKQSTSAVEENDNVLRSLLGRTRDLVPDYIIKLFQFRCNHIKQLNIDITAFMKAAISLNIIDIFMDNDTNMININLFAQIFLNITQIRIIVPNHFAFDQQIIQYLLQNLGEYSIRSLSQFEFVEFCFNMKLLHQGIRDQFTETIMKKFKNIGWMINIQNNEEDFESVYLVKINDNFISNINIAIDNSAKLQTLEDVKHFKLKNKSSRVSKHDHDNNDALDIYHMEDSFGDEDLYNYADYDYIVNEVERLSKQKKEKLTYGYIREQCYEYNVNLPNDLLRICLQYIGTRDFYGRDIAQSINYEKQLKQYVIIKSIIWLFIGIVIFYINLTKQNSLVSNISERIYPENTPQRYCCDCYKYAIEQSSKPRHEARRIDMSYCTNCFDCTACVNDDVHTFNNDQCEGSSGIYEKQECDTKYLSTTTLEIFYKNYNAYGIGALVLCILYTVFSCFVVYYKITRGTTFMVWNIIMSLTCFYMAYKPTQYQPEWIRINSNSVYCYVNIINEPLEDAISVFVYSSLSLLLMEICFFFVRCCKCCFCVRNIEMACYRCMYLMDRCFLYSTIIGGLAFYVTMITAVFFGQNFEFNYDQIVSSSSILVMVLIIVEVVLVFGVFDLFCCGFCRNRIILYCTDCCIRRAPRRYMQIASLDLDNEVLLQQENSNMMTNYHSL